MHEKPNNEDKISGIFDAIKKRDIETLSKEIKSGTDVNARYNGATMLHAASENGIFEVIEFLVGKGANVNALNKFGVTPLYQAVMRGHTEAAKFLIKKGADVNKNIEDNNISTVVRANINIIPFLLAAGLLVKFDSLELMKKKYYPPMLFSLLVEAKNENGSVMGHSLKRCVIYNKFIKHAVGNIIARSANNNGGAREPFVFITEHLSQKDIAAVLCVSKQYDAEVIDKNRPSIVKAQRKFIQKFERVSNSCVKNLEEARKASEYAIVCGSRSVKQG
jgi:hypothetical protein